MGTLTKAARPFLALQREPFSSERTWAFPANALQYPRKRGESTSLRRGDGPSEPRPLLNPCMPGLVPARFLVWKEGREAAHALCATTNERTKQSVERSLSLFQLSRRLLSEKEREAMRVPSSFSVHVVV